MTSTLKIASALLLVTFSACGSARLGSTSQHGGQVVLDGRYMPAMTEARFLMGDHCGSSFETSEHGNVVDFRCNESAGSETALAANANDRAKL